MIRKVLQQGPSSLVVSLPSSWVKQKGIKKGDEIQIIESGENLVVSSDTRHSEKSITLDITGLERKIVEKYINGAYKKGFSEIALEFKSREVLDLKQKKHVSTLEVIQERVKKLIGMEIVSSSNNDCIISEVAEVRHDELDNVLKRCMNLTVEFADYVQEAIKTCDKNAALDIDLKEDNIDKFALLAFRIISQRSDKKESLYLYDAMGSIEDISDDLAYFAKTILDTGCSITNKEFFQLYALIMKSAVLMQSIYFVFDNGKVNEFIKIRRDFFDIVGKSGAKISDKEHTHVLTSIMNSMLKVVEDRICISI